MTKEAALLIIGFLLFIPYGLSADKLSRHLKQNHAENLKNLGFPVGNFFYRNDPRAGFNLMKFVFSKETYNDIRLKSLKIQTRINSLLFLAGFIIWTIAVTSIIHRH